ncbi:hypothetical protein ACTFIR_008897 [Dictyostelium discoideum]
MVNTHSIYSINHKCKPRSYSTFQCRDSVWFDHLNTGKRTDDSPSVEGIVKSCFTVTRPLDNQNLVLSPFYEITLTNSGNDYDGNLIFDNLLAGDGRNNFNRINSSVSNEYCLAFTGSKPIDRTDMPQRRSRSKKDKEAATARLTT